MRTTLYLVRHGTTDYNEEFRFQGILDIPLNKLGLAQGALLTGYFADIPIDLAVTSPLIRARQTLDFMLGARKGSVPVVVEPNLHEINLGVLDGRPVAECNILFPQFQEDYLHHPGRLRCPGGETSKEVYDRVKEAILRIVAQHPGRTIAAASHGFAIQTWLNYASGIPAEDMREWCLDNVAVSKFTFDEGGRVTVDFIGDRSHLPEEYRRNYDWAKLGHPAPLFLFRPGPRAQEARRFLERHGVPHQERDLQEAPLRSEERLSVMSRYHGALRDFSGPLLVTKGTAFTIPPTVRSFNYAG